MSKRILIINWRGLRDEKSGGAEFTTFNYSKRWVSKHNSKVIWVSPPPSFVLKSEIIEGVEFHYLGLPFKMNWYYLLFSFPLFYFLVFWNYIFKYRNLVDIVIDKSHGVPYLTSLYSKKRVVLLIHEVAGKIWSKMYPKPKGYLKKDVSQYNICYQIFSAEGASLLLKREIADTIVLFDDKFWCYYKDTDFCHRAWFSGYEVWYYPKAVCYHNIGSISSLFSREKFCFIILKINILVLSKTLNFLNMVKYVLVYTLVLDGYLLLMILKRRFKVVWAIFRSQAYLIKTFSQIWKQRSKVQKYRKIKDNIFLKNLTREMGIWEYWRST